MRISFNFINVFFAALLILFIAFVSIELWLVRNSYFATHFIFAYAFLIILLGILMYFVYKNAMNFANGNAGENYVQEYLKISLVTIAAYVI